jgi:hypothetical protein
MCAGDEPPDDFYTSFPSEKPDYEAWGSELTEPQSELIRKMRFEVIPKLKKLGVEVFEVAQPVCPEGDRFGDFGWDTVGDMVEERGDQPYSYLDGSMIIFELRVDRTDDLFESFDEVYMQHNILPKDIKRIQRVFREVFGSSKFKWNGDDKKAILVQV